MNEQAIRDLYQSWLDAWNRQDAAGMAACLAPNGIVIGFDGSLMRGPAELETSISAIFAHHQTGRYYPIVREVRELALSVALLRADVGMVPAGQDEINPDLNAVQTVVAVNRSGRWEIELLQNTPAALHGRADLRETLTAELRDLRALSG
jgi:uncharacterized protein (TIGR02246 family)